MFQSGGDVANGRPRVCVLEGEQWEISVLSSPFCCESKSALENKHDFLPQGWKGMMGQRLCWQAEEWLRQVWVG